MAELLQIIPTRRNYSFLVVEMMTMKRGNSGPLDGVASRDGGTALWHALRTKVAVEI
jgi:hypothetical protein